MERIEEEIEHSNCKAYHNFISNSKWDYRGLIRKVGLDASEALKENKTKSKVPTGYLIDESAHLKKGDESVYLEKPNITQPEEKQGKGRKAKKLRADVDPIRVDHYMAGLDHLDWVKVNVRKTAKGGLKLKVHVVDICIFPSPEVLGGKDF